MIDPRLMKAKSKRIIEDNEDILKSILEKEIEDITRAGIVADSEFDLVKKYYMTEGIKEGLRRFVQRLNDWASKDV